MARRRHVVQYASMTSLLDVLFILVFAALTYAAQARSDEQEEPAPVATPPAPPTPGSEAERAHAQHDRALDTHGAEVRALVPVHVQVNATGVVERIGIGDEGGGMAVDIPLLEPVPDPDVRVVYAGTARGDRRICNAVATRLPGRALGEHLIIIELSTRVTELPVALVVGLRQDRERCAREHAAIAVIVEPDAGPAPQKKP